MTSGACAKLSDGHYYNVTPEGRFYAAAWKPRFMKAEQKHYLDIPPEGAWTVLLFGRPYRKWYFYINGYKLTPKKYFKKFGVIQDCNYQ